MNQISTPPRVVPTLTEVLVETDLELEPVPEGVSAKSAAPLDAVHDEESEGSCVEPVDFPAAEPDLSAADGGDAATMQDEITQRVWLDLQYQIDKIVEYRLREALAPILARVGDQLIREARSELSETMKDVVTRAVTQELARQRIR
jgi:hypothetical protein